jgi:hypothetical protein
MLALRRERIKYVFAPVWWDEYEVARAHSMRMMQLKPQSSKRKK